MNRIDEVVRVVAIEDETLQRESQAKLTGEGFRMVGVYSDVESFLRDRPEADVALLDLWIRPLRAERAPLRGLPAVQAITKRGYKILIYTSETRRAVLARLLHDGARGVVLKTEPKSTLLNAIVDVGAGRAALTSELVGLAHLYHKKGLLPRLTSRQGEILRWRARGLGVKEIAARLNFSTKTIEKEITDTNQVFADYLAMTEPDRLESHHSASVLAKTLGYEPDDLLGPPDT